MLCLNSCSERFGLCLGVLAQFSAVVCLAVPCLNMGFGVWFVSLVGLATQNWQALRHPC